MNRHICDERATREKFNLVGKELPTTHGIAWCGEHYVGWAFCDPNHALLSLKYSGSVAPCHACLLAIRDVVDKELGPFSIRLRRDCMGCGRPVTLSYDLQRRYFRAVCVCGAHCTSDPPVKP